MDDEFYTIEEWRPSAKLRWQSVAGVLFTGVSGALNEVAGMFDGIGVLLGADANYRTDLEQSHQQAALELEMLLRGESE